MENTYWERRGQHQADYDRLWAELVPPQGDTGTVEGECLRSATRLYHEFRNNGGGNNVSAGLMFLRERFPQFETAWWDTLAPYVTGRGPQGEEMERVLEATESIMDTVVPWVMSRQGNYTSTGENIWDFMVERTGMEVAFDDPCLDDEFDGLYSI